MSALNVLAIVGSLRRNSYNRAAFRAAVELAPAGMLIEDFDIGEIPPYNEDVREQGLPPTVNAFRERIRAADALLFVTPEYNYSVPGVLKNAIDWASRPPSQPFDGKPVAIMGASGSLLGTARAQYHLRQICVFLNMFPINKPEVMIASAATRFDEEGRLVDSKTRELVGALLVSLKEWTMRLRDGLG